MVSNSNKDKRLKFDEIKQVEFKNMFIDSVSSLHEYMFLSDKGRDELSLGDIDSDYDLSLPIALKAEALAYFLPSILKQLEENFYGFLHQNYVKLFIPPLNSGGQVRERWLKSGYYSYLSSNDCKCVALSLERIFIKYDECEVKKAIDIFWNKFI